MAGDKKRLIWTSVILLAGCASSSQQGHKAPAVKSTAAMKVDMARGELRLTATIQKTDAPRMKDWGQAGPALLGSRGGQVEKFFVFLLDAPVKDVHHGLLRLGARSRVVYKTADVAKHEGFRPDGGPEDYQQGDPVQIYVEWKSGGRVRRLAYEDFFMQKITVGRNTTVKPWTPHFVFHGSGALNSAKTGCVACTHDCPGGIIANNQYPLVEPKPVLRADWKKLPAPGTRVTVVLRPVPSGK